MVEGEGEMSGEIGLYQIINQWQLPEDGLLLERIERMIRPALLAGYFGSSYTRLVSGLQYHLGGEQDTAELADLAAIRANDYVLDVCCFIGGPAVQLADTFGCKVTGIDLAESPILAANRIAELAGLSERLNFQVADAGALPFQDETFTVIWNQCSLQHSQLWLKEFDRVLAPGGRFAFTFQMRGVEAADTGPFSSWTLPDVVRLIDGLGYTIEHADDITERDIEIGWQVLDRKLSTQEREFRTLLGAEWVRQAHQEFANGIAEMRAGKWGNGRIVAIKKGMRDSNRNTTQFNYAHGEDR
jgi:ubiquinone/menaquinone biosynthesis C-methylase UbiE